MVNVVSYGADPTGTNDSTSAIHNAINTLSSGRGGVCFPGGNYLISSPLTVDADNITLYSLENATITIKAGSDPSYALIVGNTRNVNYCNIYGLNFQGLASSASTGGSINFRSFHGSIKQTKVFQFGGPGINVASFSGSLFEVYMEDILLQQNGMNASSPSDNLVLANNVSDCEYHRLITRGDVNKSTTRHGINNSAANQKFVNCHAYFCSQNGFNDNGVNTQIIGGEWETNGNRGIGSFNICFGMSNAYMYNNGNLGIDLQSSGFAVNNCQFQSNTNNDLNVNNYGSIGNCVCSGSYVGVQIGSGAEGAIIHDNVIASSTQNTVTIAGTKCIIHDNVIRNGNIIEQAGANNNSIHDNILL